MHSQDVRQDERDITTGRWQMNHLNHSIAGADGTTHLKIVGVALLCSVVLGLGFNATLFAQPTPKPQIADAIVMVPVENTSVCRMIVPRHGPTAEVPSI